MSLNSTELTDIGVFIAGKVAIDAYTATAGGSGDATAANGIEVDLLALTNKPRSMKVQIGVTAVLAATKTAVLVAKVQHRDTGGSWADYTYDPRGGTIGTTTLTLTGQSGGSTERGVLEINCNLEGAKQNVRVTVTPDLSATGTDTAAIWAIYNFGGNVLPAAL